MPLILESRRVSRVVTNTRSSTWTRWRWRDNDLNVSSDLDVTRYFLSPKMPSLSTLEAGDTPVEGLKLVSCYVTCRIFPSATNINHQSTLDGPLRLPAIVFGAGAFSNQYNTDDHLASNTPLETVRLALR
jgi:hypothetical protein